MEATLGQVLPVFVIVAAGYVVARFRYLPENLFYALIDFVLYVAIPVFVFRSLARSSLLDKSPGNLAEFLVLYFLGAALALALGIAVSRYAFKGNPDEQLHMAMTGSHANTALLGIPAVTVILASKVITPLALLVGFHGFVMAGMVAVILSLRHRTGSLPQDVGKALLVQIKSPIFIAAAAGVIYGKLDLPLPGAADRPLQLVAMAGVPCGLFALGGALLPYRIGSRPQVDIAAAAVKLVAQPFIVWLLAVQLKLLAIPASWAWAAVMVAAMPASLELLMRDDNTKSPATGTAILVSTLLGLVTVTVLTHLIRNA